jgi:pentatricopeptide repeat protein
MAPGAVQLNILAWNKRFEQYVKNGQPEKVMQLFQQLQQEGISVNKFTFLQVINACASLRALGNGRLVHEQLVQSGWESDVFLGSSLINMYAKCGSIEDAHRVFNKIPAQDLITRTAMILGHVKCGQGQKALELF